MQSVSPECFFGLRCGGYIDNQRSEDAAANSYWRYVVQRDCSRIYVGTAGRSTKHYYFNGGYDIGASDGVSG